MQGRNKKPSRHKTKRPKNIFFLIMKCIRKQRKRKFYAYFKSGEQVIKNVSPKKVITQQILWPWIKTEKSQISFTFCWNVFQVNFDAIFFNYFEISVKICVFDTTSDGFPQNIFFIFVPLFQTLKPKEVRALKIQNIYWYNYKRFLQLIWIWHPLIGQHHGRMNYKDSEPRYVGFSLKIDLLTDFSACF